MQKALIKFKKIKKIYLYRILFVPLTPSIVFLQPLSLRKHIGIADQL